SVEGLLISANGVGIENGDMIPSEADFTDFANDAVFGPTLTRTYTISNLSGAAIDLIGGAHLIQISGPDAADFVVSSSPAASLAAGASSSFTISFSPLASGTRSATVTIPNSMVGAPPYSFAIE